MRLFISYARVDKPYCVQIAETLDIHDIWFDQRLYAGQQWWKEILRRLDWCEGFVYLLSPDSVTSEYCQRELTIAQNLGRHIFPVLIYEKTPIPESLKLVQYADLSRGLTPEAVKTLLNAIYMAERRDNERQNQHLTIAEIQPPPPAAVAAKQAAPTSSTLTTDTLTLADFSPHPPQELAVVVGKAAEAMESAQFDQAVFLLKQAQESGIRSRFINLDILLHEAEASLERQTRQREAEREYKPIVELVRRNSTRKLGCDAFRAYLHDFPEHDPENLANVCETLPPSVATSNGSTPHPPFTLPLLEWCEVPEGMLVTNKLDGSGRSHKDTQYIEYFQISRYPVTNTQFQAFVDDKDGYYNPTCWTFSPDVLKWHNENPDARPPRFKGEDRPRENVTWYEALAFCHWLSDKTGLQITLPTDVQWQRAARGDDERLYPWGNDFDISLANTRESKVRMTTLVMRYAHAPSPFGVVDMAGNVWEWCLNAGSKDVNNQEGEGMRAIYGGSFISVAERSQTHFHFNLSPEYFYATIGFRVVSTFF